ncbi:MAG: ribosome silencing factor [Firmicutes bacterium]|nr:ribosome silencing factor [Bacillota bacterium]
MDETQVLLAAWAAVNETKGENPLLLDLRELTVITDYFLIASARNAVHLQALADAVLDKLEEQELTPKRIEGYREARWILLDYGFMVVHLMTPEEREFYRLEQLWHGAKITTLTLA